MASDDLFSWLDAIWNKGKPEGVFPSFIAHRFLASDRFWANAARVLGKDVRDPAMTFSTWQALTAEERGAPRLTYPAAKKRPGAEPLTLRMMAVLGVRRTVAEDMQALVMAAGRLDALYREFGVEAPNADAVFGGDDEEQPKRKKGKAPAGLMGMLAK